MGKERRYFISFMDKENGELRYSFRILTFSKGVFNIKEIIKHLEKEEGISDIVIMFFKELTDYEIGEKIK